jgi:hypothetical protein
MPAVVDDEDVAGPRGIDHLADAEILRREVAAAAGDLAHGHGAADASRARHHLGEAGKHALETDIVQGVGQCRRRQFREPLQDLVGYAHDRAPPLRRRRAMRCVGEVVSSRPPFYN